MRQIRMIRRKTKKEMAREKAKVRMSMRSWPFDLVGFYWSGFIVMG